MEADPFDMGDRRAELLAAALAGELTTQQQRELDALVVADPTVAELLAELRDTASMLRASGVTWQEVEPSPGLGERLAAAVSNSPASGATGDVGVQGHRGSRLFRSLVGAAAAAALLVTGAVLGGGLWGGVEQAPIGPPGTLGAIEDITFTGGPGAGTIEASLVAHTWGTETVLEVDGVTPGEIYEVVLVSDAGEQVTSGTFLGTEQTVTCRLNAAVLRADLARVVIERADGTVLATSSVPTVEG